jgi:Mg2+/Co2+ transporter CorC
VYAKQARFVSNITQLNVRHRRVVVLIENGKELEQLLREFRIHRGPTAEGREFLLSGVYEE